MLPGTCSKCVQYLLLVENKRMADEFGLGNYGDEDNSETRFQPKMGIFFHLGGRMLWRIQYPPYTDVQMFETFNNNTEIDI